MFLKRAILINWGNIPNIELDFGPVNLFSGGNGSGKTTAADAIQALMTAAHENLFAFNPGQDETTQRGRGGKQVRTLASYLLGCDDGSYARPNACDGYVAGVFSPTQGETGEVFTAVMAMRGHLESSGNIAQARLDELTFFILPEVQLKLSDFIKKDSGGQYLIESERIAASFKKVFGAGNVEQYEKKGAYLQRLYAMFKGKKGSVSSTEAKHAAKTFSGFMAYKPVKSIHDFVAQEILEAKDLGDAIRSVSDLMQTVHQMEANAARIKSSVNTLELARQQSEQYTQLWVDSKVYKYALQSQLCWQTQQHYLAQKEEQQKNLLSIEDVQSKIDINADKKSSLQQDVIVLEAKRQGIPALRKKDELESSIKRCNLQLASLKKPIAEQLQYIRANFDTAIDLQRYLKQYATGVDIPELDSKALHSATKQVSQASQAAELDAFELFNQDWIDLSPLEQKIADILEWQKLHNQWAGLFRRGDDSIKNQVISLLDRRKQRRLKLDNDCKRKKQELQLLQNQQVSYPSYVEQAIQAIQNQCPEANPKVLCDFVDVNDSHWQMAIEGYIGGARYSIIVEREYEAIAINIVRAMRQDRRNKARVIQGTKAASDAARGSINKHSIIELMSFSHSTAKDYLSASYGNVLQVEDADQLKMTARGITADGLACGSYAMWRCDLPDSDLVFGQAARQRAQVAKEQELEALLIELHQTEESYQHCLRLQELVSRIHSIEVAEKVQGLLPLLRELHKCERELQDLDFSDSDNLEHDLEQAKTTLRQLERNQDELTRQSGALALEQKQHKDRIRKLSDDLDEQNNQKDQLELVVTEINNVLPRFDSEQALREADAHAQASSIDTNEGEAIRQQLDLCERALFTSVQTHNQHAESIDQLIYDTGINPLHSAGFFKLIAGLHLQIDRLHNRLKNNILVERHRALETLKDSFNTAFVTNLCHSIYQSISSGKHALEDLNRELQHHRFGADRERFYFGMTWVPEFQEYWQFFKAIINNPKIGDGSTLFDIELSDKLAATRDKLLDMLLDEDSDKAFRELSRISDYRNYRRYEIYKEPEGKQPIALSQYGTGSGGQLETPAYIIRSAAVTSAFRFNEGSNHLRMVMVDEAFSKMDENRSREVIHYLTNSLGLQLIFIMPTSKSGPFMDIISNQFVYTKCPTTEPIGQLNTRVLVDRKQCNKEQIAKLWAKHRKTIRDQAMLDFMEDI